MDKQYGSNYNQSSPKDHTRFTHSFRMKNRSPPPRFVICVQEITNWPVCIYWLNAVSSKPFVDEILMCKCSILCHPTEFLTLSCIRAFIIAWKYCHVYSMPAWNTSFCHMCDKLCLKCDYVWSFNLLITLWKAVFILSIITRCPGWKSHQNSSPLVPHICVSKSGQHCFR